MIGPGPGIYSTFGWRPVGKYDFAVAAATQVIDPLPVTFDRVVRMLIRFSDNTGFFRMRINDDPDNLYASTNHFHGKNAGVDKHEGGVYPNLSYIYLTAPPQAVNLFYDLMFCKVGVLLRIAGEGSAFTDMDNFCQYNLAAFYTGAAPYTQMSIYEGSAVNFTCKVELFESVYGF